MGFKATAMGSVLGAGLLLYGAGSMPAMPDVSGLADPFLPNPAMIEIKVGLAGEDLKRSELDTKKTAIEVAELELESKIRIMGLENELTKSQIDLATQRALGEAIVKQEVEKALMSDWVWAMIEMAWLIIVVLVAPVVGVVLFLVRTMTAYKRYANARG